MPGKEPREIEEGSLTKQVGTVFKLDDTYSLFGRYAEGFKMPTAQQLHTSLPLFDGTNSIIPNPDLKPESVKSYEAGLRGRFQRGFFSISVFYADYTNFIQSLAPVPNSGDVTNINLSKVQLKGVEAFAEVQLHENWFANLAMTYQYGDQMASPGAQWDFVQWRKPADHGCRAALRQSEPQPHRRVRRDVCDRGLAHDAEQSLQAGWLCGVRYDLVMEAA